MPLGLVRFPGAARDFSPRVNFQCRLSYSVRTPPCVRTPYVACILICAHVKDPVVLVRVRWIMETLKHPACTLDWVTRLSQLAFPGKSNPNFPWKKSHRDNIVVKKQYKSLHEQPLVLPMWKLRWRFHLLSLYFCPHGMGTFWCIFDYLPLPANPTPLKVTELSHQQINWPI